MAADLHERLSDLASITPLASPPADLWSRGVRRRRVAAVARTSVAVVLVLLVGLGGWVWHSSRPVEPADTHGAPHLPDRFYEPSPWLPSFDGPPGQLVAVGTAPRKTVLHTHDEAFGVTASSGQYGFLDLPRYAVTQQLGESDAPVLSPDGTRVAFWTTGVPSGAANTHLVGVTVTGVGVYDTTTGRAWRTPVPTKHGLRPSTLKWLDNDELVLAIDQASFGDSNENSCCAGHWQGLATWRVGDLTGITTLPTSLPLFMDERETSARAGRVLFVDEHRLHLIDPRQPATDRVLTTPQSTSYAVLSPDRRRVAYLTGDDSTPPDERRIQIAQVPRGTSTKAEPVHVIRTLPPRRSFDTLVTWVDDGRVAAFSRFRLAHQVNDRLGLVDVRSGAVRTLVSPSSGTGGRSPMGLSLAGNLLSSPLVHADPPPRPWDRRDIAIWLTVAAGLAMLVLIGKAWESRGRRA